MIAYRVHGSVAVLELRAPPANAITFDVLDALRNAVRRAIAEREVRAIVVCGDGARFSAGADLGIFAGIRTPDDAVHASRVFQEAFQEIEDAPKPVLAAVAGHVLGGALELAMACHLRLAAAGSRFSMPEVNLGINPGAGGTQRLPRLVGLPAALELLLGGRPIDAEQALQRGLIDGICSAETLIETAIARAADCAEQSALTPGSSPAARAREAEWSPADLVLAPRRTRFLADRLADSAANRAAFAEAESKLASVRPELIAPQKILEAVRTGIEDSFAAGLLCEQRVFCQCMQNRATQSKIHILCASEAARRPKAVAANARPLARAGVLGLGTMGAGIAQALLLAGLPVTACDANPTALEAAGQRIADSLRRRVAQGKLAEGKAQAALDRLSTSADPQALATAEIVVEAVYESVEVKRAALTRLEEICPAETILATNTSSINLDVLAAGLRHPQRLAGLHFFHPAQQMPLVEVIRRRGTSPELVATLLGLVRAMGKTPVVVENREGFIVNRLFIPYLTEAFWLLEEGAAPEVIDGALVDFGFAMGPLQLIDMSGLDILEKTQPILHQVFPWHGDLPPIVRDLVAEGHLGQKTGAGVYQYAPGDRTPRPHARALALIDQARRRRGTLGGGLAPDQLVARLMLRMVAEAYRLLEEAVVASPADIDLAMVLGTGLADYRGGVLKYAADLGLTHVMQALAAFAAHYGPRYEACPLLKRKAQEK